MTSPGEDGLARWVPLAVARAEVMKARRDPPEAADEWLRQQVVDGRVRAIFT